MRGFIGGLAIGLVTVMLGVVALTLLWPATPRPDVSDSGPLPVSGNVATSEGTSAGVAVVVVDNDLIEMAPAAPAVTASDEPLSSDNSPADKPIVVTATSGLNDPTEASESVEIAITSEAPIDTAQATTGLDAPSSESEPKALVNPDQVEVSDGSQAGAGFGNGTEIRDTVPEVGGQGDQAPVSVGASLVGTPTEAGEAPNVVGLTSRAPTPQTQENVEIGFAAIKDEAPTVLAVIDPTLATSKVGNGPTAPGAEQLPELSTQSAAIPSSQTATPAELEPAAATQETSPRVSDVSDTAPSAQQSAEPEAPQSDTEPNAVMQTAEVPIVATEPPAVYVPKIEKNAPSNQVSPVAPLTPVEPKIAGSIEALPIPAGVYETTPRANQSTRSELLPANEGSDDDPQIAALPQAGIETTGSSPRAGKRVVPLTERKKSSTVSNEAGTGIEKMAQEPLKANAVAFENPEARPLMAIVLIDDTQSLGSEALTEFPYPLTFAVDPNDPKAAAKMERHREAGFEVVMLTDLEVEARPQDAEVSLSVWMDKLPQVVALLEGSETGFQGNRDLSDQVTAIVDQSGLGMIMQAKGLNTAFKLAAREGVPAALVFRDFDGAGQSPTVIRRFLDQAAFRAGQNGGVIMLGRLRPETISALLLWGLQDRASRVALAPVSALLTQ